MVAIEREDFGDGEIHTKCSPDMTEFKHDTVDFMCICHWLYFTQHLSMTKISFFNYFNLFLHLLLDSGNDDDYEHGLLPANACNVVKKTMTTITSSVTGPSNSTMGSRLATPVELV